MADSQDLLSLTDGIVQLRLAADVQPYSVAIVQPATLPAKAAGAPPPVLGLLGATFGLLVGVGLIGVREQSDRRVSSLRELERVTRAPVLCRVSSARALRSTDRPSDLEPPDAEPFRLLLARLRTDPSPRASEVVAVASPEQDDDAYGAAWHLAAAAATAGIPTLLVVGEIEAADTQAEQHASGSDGNGQSNAPSGDLGVGHLYVGSGRGVDVIARRGAGAGGSEAAGVADSVLEVAGTTYEMVIVVTPSPPIAEAAVGLLRGQRVITVCRRGLDRDSAGRLRQALATLDARVVGVVAVGFGGDRYP